MIRTSKRWITMVAMVVVALLTAPAAWAIDSVKGPDAGAPIIHWIVTLVLAGLCGLVLFKNAKRTPND